MGRHPFFGCRYCLVLLPLVGIVATIVFYGRLLLIAEVRGHEGQQVGLGQQHQCQGYGAIVDRQQAALAIPGIQFDVNYDWKIAHEWIHGSGMSPAEQAKTGQRILDAIALLWPESKLPSWETLERRYGEKVSEFGGKSDPSMTLLVERNAPVSRHCLWDALRQRWRDHYRGQYSFSEATHLISYHCPGIVDSDAEAVEQAWDPVLYAVLGFTEDRHPYEFYPEKSMAAHLLGFFNAEGKATSGVIYAYSDYLQGKATFQAHGVASRPYVSSIHASYLPSFCAHDLVLTIQREAQMAVEEVLRQAVTRYQCDSGVILAIDPRNGEIMASASWPTFDPNKFGETYAKNLEAFRDRALMPYEPGSVFKPFVVAAAIESLGITPDTIFHDTGVIEYGSRSFYNAERKAYGDVSVREILRESLNVDMVQMAIELGPQRLYKYVNNFGFGQPTKVDFGIELPGNVRQPGDLSWSKSDLATCSFGQGLMATPMQLITAYGALANGGVLMRPHVVYAFVQDRRWYQVPPKERRQVIRKETSHQITSMLESVVQRWAGNDRVPGYRVAGKTGTAEISQGGKYNQPLPDATFIGYLPAEAPRLVILVKLHKPAKGYWAYNSALPTFMQVARKLVTILDIPPSQAKSP